MANTPERNPAALCGDRAKRNNCLGRRSREWPEVRLAASLGNLDRSFDFAENERRWPARYGRINVWYQRTIESPQNIQVTAPRAR